MKPEEAAYADQTRKHYERDYHEHQTCEYCRAKLHEGQLVCTCGHPLLASRGDSYRQVQNAKQHKEWTNLYWEDNSRRRKPASCTPTTWHGICKKLVYRTCKRGIRYSERQPEPDTWKSLHHRWRWDTDWRANMEQNGWTEETIMAADEEAQRPGDFVPMSEDDREEYLPPMVLRQTKVGGASIKTTEHPTWPQAIEQYPYDSGARGSTDAAPRRFAVHDRFRNHDDNNDAWVNHAAWQGADSRHDDPPWHEDTLGDNRWKDAPYKGRDYDRYRR